jgi:hypothetical protein
MYSPYTFIYTCNVFNVEGEIFTLAALVSMSCSWLKYNDGSILGAETCHNIKSGNCV